MGDVEAVLMHPLMVLIRLLPVLICGLEGGALASTTGAKAWIGGAHRVEYSCKHQLLVSLMCYK